MPRGFPYTCVASMRQRYLGLTHSLGCHVGTAPKFAVLGFLFRCACMGCDRCLECVLHALHCITLLDKLTPC